MRLRRLATAIFAVAPFVKGQSPVADPDWSSRLQSAIRLAVARNPELSAMESRIEASRQRVAQAGSFPDPELEVGIKDIPVSSPSLTRDNFTMEMITARQSLPGRGKLATRRASAEAASENALAMHAVHAVGIAADVADAFFGIAELDMRLEILERSRQRLKTTSASAKERYEVGKAGQSDVLRANLAATALEDRLLSLRAERRVLSARWNALQALPARAAVPVIGPLDPVPSIPDSAAVEREAEEKSPAVAAARATLRRSKEELRLAGLDRRPDWMVSTYYGRREKFEDLAGAFVSINLPFAHPRRLEAKRAEMAAELSSARADLEAVRNQIRRDVEAAAVELERNVEQEKLYRTTIVPQAEINFRAAQESYAVGQIDFETYVRAALDLDTYEGEIATRAAGIGRALAALQKASGLPLIAGTPSPGEPHEK
ncbi:MAG: TolC family protein [Thermoanaerobaculia bacterium]